MRGEPLKIKRKCDDANRVISIRIREEVIAELDQLADTSNRSRNEIINLILEHGLKNTEIEEKKINNGIVETKTPAQI